jgi:hypothetical protein
VKAWLDIGTKKDVLLLVFKVVVLSLSLSSVVYLVNLVTSGKKTLSNIQAAYQATWEELQKTSKDLEDLKNEDQYKRNQDLNTEIENIRKTYSSAVASYEGLLKLKDSTKDTESLDQMFTKALVSLSKRDYKSASETLTEMDRKVKEEQDKIAASFKVPESAPVQNTPPGAGYSRQRVETEVGTFLVSIIAADLGSTRVIVDTASEGTCHNDCPVLPLASYVSRNNAFAGVNGSYFCPATYPSCAGKTNSFDTLLMNKNKAYFNSDNNVYSDVPAVIFGGSWVRFVSASKEWGRDTGIDSMIANQPLLVRAGQVAFGGDSDPKKGSKGGRSFVADKGSNIHIGVVHSATVAESARVLKAMGMDNALNLDNGGSTALWYGGYKVGPGRNLPNVVLFVRK